MRRIGGKKRNANAIGAPRWQLEAARAIDGHAL